MAEKKEKTITKAGTGEKVVKKAEEKVKEAPKTEKKVEEAAKEAPKTEKKAKETAPKGEKKVKEAAPVGNAKKLRWGAVVLWLVALGFEAVAYFLLTGKISIGFLNNMNIPTLYQAIGALALDFGAVVWGAQLWKKANHIDPVSEKNKLKWWLWDNMGVIACAFCFIPFIILVLSNKEMDQKTKKIASIVAAVLVVIGGLLNYDWNPVSEEMKDTAVNTITDDVYWSPYGKVYHTSTECQALNNSDSLTEGTVEQAIAANRSRLCSFCAKRDNIDGVATD